MNKSHAIMLISSLDSDLSLLDALPKLDVLDINICFVESFWSHVQKKLFPCSVGALFRRRRVRV